MRRAVCVLFAFVPALLAQPAVAPTDVQVGPVRGENTSTYNIRQSFELGYRFHSVDGNEGMYRSVANFGNGVRLLGSSLSVQSREGHGGFFDQIVLNTQGLGNDPYQSANLRVEKNKLYRYDLLWRSNAYFNPAARISGGEHLMDTRRNLQDQDLTIFPQGSLKFFLGYSRNTQSGPGLSTINLFDATRGDEFATFANIRREQNEYRLGTEINAAGFRLNLLHSWVDFKEDSPQALVLSRAGNNTTEDTTLSTFRRSEPYHGTSPYWRVMLFRESKWYAVNGRFTYVTGKRAFVEDELAIGTNRLGNSAQRQIVSFGDARRPAATGNLTFSIFPASNITLTNQTSIYSIRMVGNSWFSQVDNNSVARPLIAYEYLGLRTLANSTDMDARVTSWFAVHGGFVYSDRRISSIQAAQSPSLPPAPPAVEQTNILRSGILGLRFKPIKPLTINLDAELGRASNPFYTISEKNYHALRGRVEYKLRRVRVAGYSRTFYNFNSESLASYQSRSRQAGLDFSWTARTWFSIDANYTKQHLDTLGVLQYYAALTGNRIEPVSGDQSLYVSNLHTGSLAARFGLWSRVDLSAGLSISQDVGDGRATATASNPSYVSVAGLRAAQTFPLRYLSPMARVSVAITPKIRWNLGYQRYDYREDFASLQNFRANTGYTSVSWAF